MSYVLGLSLIALAVVVALFGDRTIEERGGVVHRMFTWPKGRATLVKWPIAGVLVFTGLWVLLRL